MGLASIYITKQIALCYSNRYFLVMLLGIGLLVLIASILKAPVQKVYEAYQVGGDWLFWFVAPATVSFAVPLYKRNDIFKKHWDVIVIALAIGLGLSLFGIYGISRLLGLTDAALGAMLVQAATTAIALPVAESVGGDQAIAAFAVILNSVLIYALGDLFYSLVQIAQESARCRVRIRNCR